MPGGVDKALRRIARRAALIGHVGMLSVKWVLFVLFLGSLVLTIDESIAGSVPLWFWILLAVITAVPNLLQTLDWVWGLGGRYEKALKRTESEIERRLRRRWERRLFELYGAEELAHRRQLDEADMPYFSVSHRTRLRRKTRRGAALALVLVVSVLVAVQFLGSSSVHYLAVGQQFELDGTFAMTVRGNPSCRRSTSAGTGDNCDVRVAIHNISHYNADIGAGSFVPVQETGNGEYGASLYSHGNYYDYVDGQVDNNVLSPRTSTEATLEFNVPTGVTPEELRVEARDQSGVSVVVFRGSGTDR